MIQTIINIRNCLNRDLQKGVNKWLFTHLCEPQFSRKSHFYDFQNNKLNVFRHQRASAQAKKYLFPRKRPFHKRYDL